MQTPVQRSLSAKVTILVSFLTICTFLGLFLTNHLSQRSSADQHIVRSCERVAALLQMAIHTPMTVGDDAGTAAQFGHMADRFEDITVYLTDAEGRITYATNTQHKREDVRALLGKNHKAVDLVDKALIEPTEEHTMAKIDNVPLSVRVISVENAPECHHCHGEANAILGAMVIGQDVTPEMGELRANQVQNAAISLGGVALLLGVLITFTQKFVIRRILTLAHASQAISHGELDVRFDVGGNDEITELASNLTVMVDNLKESMTEADQQSQQANHEAERAREAVREAEEARAVAKNIAAYQASELENLSAVLARMAEGDLTARYRAAQPDAEAQEVYENFRTIESNLGTTAQGLSAMLLGIRTHAETLAAASEQLSAVSSQLSSNAEELSTQAGSTAGATEQISTNIGSMAAATEEVSLNINAVSSTAEEMSVTMDNVAESMESMRSSIAQVAENAQDGARVAAEAMELAANANTAMGQLDTAATDIGKVTEVIKRIAEQTNLLALNATIEAASAGEAGRGFAVVAGEIKELANQSAKAAEDIADRIEGVQHTTSDAVTIIGDVTAIIGRINTAVGVITEAAQDQASGVQTITTNVDGTSKGAADIAVSIAELAKGANDISRNAGEVARGSSEVSEGIHGVSRGAETSRQGASQVHHSADDLARVAGELMRMVGKFSMNEEQ